jgi:hypothetical protein
LALIKSFTAVVTGLSSSISVNEIGLNILLPHHYDKTAAAYTASSACSRSGLRTTRSAAAACTEPASITEKPYIRSI